MRIAVAPSVRLHVRHWPGDDPPFMLVHGLASNARMWDGVAGRLADAGHQAVAVDQRGHGRSDKPDDGYDFATLSADLVAVADHLGFGPFVAAGQSWGANVVVELAARHPDRVRAVACIDGAHRDMRDRLPDWEEAQRRLAPPDLVGTPLADMHAHVRRMHPDWPETGIEGALANFEVREDGTVAPWLTRDRHMTILRQLWEHRPSQVRERVQAPLVLVSARDHDADHDIHAQKPDFVAQLLLDLIR